MHLESHAVDKGIEISRGMFQAPGVVSQPKPQPTPWSPHVAPKSGKHIPGNLTSRHLSHWRRIFCAQVTSYVSPALRDF